MFLKKYSQYNQLKYNTFNLNYSFLKLKTFKFSSMNLHEYQAQGLLKQYKVPIPNGVAITNEADIESTVKNLGKSSGYAVKAQVL